MRLLHSHENERDSKIISIAAYAKQISSYWIYSDNCTSIQTQISLFLIITHDIHLNCCSSRLKTHSGLILRIHVNYFTTRDLRALYIVRIASYWPAGRTRSKLEPQSVRSQPIIQQTIIQLIILQLETKSRLDDANINYKLHAFAAGNHGVSSLIYFIPSFANFILICAYDSISLFFLLHIPLVLY